MSRDNKFYGKRRLCKTSLKHFDNIQRLGSDQLYKRYNSVESILRNNIAEEYRDFLAQPDYDPNYGTIVWYGVQWRQAPRLLTELEGDERAHYEAIKEETLQHYREAIERSRDEDERRTLAGIISGVDDRFIYCYDDRVVVVAWGMRAKESKLRVFPLEALYEAPMRATPAPDPAPDPAPVPPSVPESRVEEEPESDLVVLTFNPGAHGRLGSGSESITVERGSRIDPLLLPEVVPESRYTFEGWDRSIDEPVTEDTTMTAQYRRRMVTVTFRAGINGFLRDNVPELQIPVEAGTVLDEGLVPQVKSAAGYRFAGWTVDLSRPLERDTVVTAQFRRRKRVRWERWLLWALLLLLSLLLLGWLLSGGCSDVIDSRSEDGGSVDTVAPLDSIRGSDGSYRDDNGRIRDILDDGGRLPDDVVVPPVVGDDGRAPRIIDSDEQEPILADRLVVFLTDDNADLQEWVNDFKARYPSKDYSVIGADPNSHMLVIQVPSEVREALGKRLPQELTRQPFFVVDDILLSTNRQGSRHEASPALRGWHLRAVRAMEAWQVTKGSPDVIVAVVDDGIDGRHPIFEGRFYRPYNVFTQDNHLGVGMGHGTHVAALAAGSATYYDRGAAGIAPGCRIMPVQVFDNKYCTLSSIASGVMYAVLHGADVVNISIGLSDLDKFARLPRQEQYEMIRSYFRAHERVLRHLFAAAAKHNTIIVLAAGNENIVAAVSPWCRAPLATINVAAVAPDKTLTDFTNYDLGSNISAPGDDIYSAVPYSSFDSWSGTSMAAPIVSGAVALLRSEYPSLTVLQALYLLRRTAVPVDEQGYSPMIQVDKALLLLRQMVQDGSIDSIGSDDTGRGVTPVPPSASDGSDSKYSTPLPDSADDSCEPGTGRSPGEVDPKAALRARLKELQRQMRLLRQEIDTIQRQLQE